MYKINQNLFLKQKNIFGYNWDDVWGLNGVFFCVIFYLKCSTSFLEVDVSSVKIK